MSELVPERRADKNGVISTKWVKKDAGSVSSLSGIPAPAAPLIEPRAGVEILSEYEEFFASYEASNADYSVSLSMNVRKMGKSTAERLLNKMYDGGNFRNIWDVSYAVRDIYGNDSSVEPQYRDVVLNNFMDIVPDYGMLPDSDEEYVLDFTRNLFSDFGGLQTTGQYPKEQSLVYASVVALATDIFETPTVIHKSEMKYIKEKGFDATNDRISLTDFRGVNLLLKAPEHIDRIRGELMERKTFTPEVIQEMLPAGVLGNGAL